MTVKKAHILTFAGVTATLGLLWWWHNKQVEDQAALAAVASADAILAQIPSSIMPYAL